MGSLCSSERKCGLIEDECNAESASGRYSSLNPSRRCSFMLETPRVSTSDNSLFAKSVPGSPWANHMTSVDTPTHRNVDSMELEWTNPLFTPLLMKLLRPGVNQDLVQAGEEGESDSASSEGSSSPTRCSMDVEVMSSGSPPWRGQSLDLLKHQDLQLLERNGDRS